MLKNNFKKLQKLVGGGVLKAKNLNSSNSSNPRNLNNFKKIIALSLFCLVFFVLPQITLADLSFSEDTIISLTGISDGDLYVASTSVSSSVSVDGAGLTVDNITASGDFILKTSTHDNALKLTPSGGTLDLTFNSSNLSSGNITQWTLDSSTTNTTVAHVVGASLANTWYQISVGGIALNSYQTNSNGELSFTYSGGFSSKVFTISQDTTSPASFSLTSPTNNSSVVAKPTFTWNASTDSDLSHYNLYIDSSLQQGTLTTTSYTLTTSLSCGTHPWYVSAVDNAGNSTNSSTFTSTVTCGGGIIAGFIPQNIPTPRQVVVKEGETVYLDEISSKDESKIEELFVEFGQASTPEEIQKARQQLVVVIEQTLAKLQEQLIVLLNELVTELLREVQLKS